MLKRKWIGLWIWAFVLALPASGSEFQEDLKARRERVMQKLGPEAMMILWSAPPRLYSRDIYYEYRQDSNFYYLTGIDQEETILVLMPGYASQREILFIKPKDPVREHWQGRLLSREDATALSGIAAVYLTGEFEPFVEAMLSGRPYNRQAGAETGEPARFLAAVASGTGRVAIILDAPASAPGRAGEFAAKVRERFKGVAIQDPQPILGDLRAVKSPYEIKVLRRSVEIAAEAQMAGMRAAHPGAFEYEVKAAIEYIYKARGAWGWSYPPIVGSGPNANILHYSGSARQMEAGDLMLVDAACNFNYLSGDITRTYPVSGQFTPEQKDIYGIALKAYEEGRAAARRGVTLADVHQKAVEAIKDGLLRLGLITDASGDQYRTWYTHGTCHYIGMDVHDVGDNRRPMEPGMTFAMEPGVYIRESALDALPKTPENEAFITRVQPAARKYNQIGVRVEDSFLITETGVECLSPSVPRTIEEIEAYLKSQAGR